MFTVYLISIVDFVVTRTDRFEGRPDDSTLEVGVVLLELAGFRGILEYNRVPALANSRFPSKLRVPALSQIMRAFP